MPNPKKYKSQKKFMCDCLHQTVTVEGRKKDQGLAMCLNMWKNRGKKKKMARNVIANFIEAATNIRLFLDDIRDPKEYGLHDVFWVKNYNDAIKELKTGKVTWISFDHDLGEDKPGVPSKSGYDVAKFIEEALFNKEIPLPEWQIHSANPKGRQDITMAMKSAERFNKENV